MNDWKKINYICESPHPAFTGAAITKVRPVHFTTERSRCGFTDASTVRGGWRKVVAGKIRIDNRTFHHRYLHRINGYWIKVEFIDPAGMELQMVFGPTLDEEK